ncbi:MAG: N-acetylmuramoyl-L-alanine amidase [Clostridiales bacterium]|nr:N-acetylmuramoyl-L-alanine amidase [Clostridiales bacterium]
MKRRFLILFAIGAALLLFAGCGVAEVPEATDTPEPTGTPFAVEIAQVTLPPTATPAPTDTPEPTPSPTPTPKPLEGKIIGIDPGHQRKGNHDTEPQSPDSPIMKAKCSSGTRALGGAHEYEVNLEVALRLRALLEELGATVIMTRESHAVDISNIERALIFNAAGTDYALRLHCNGVDNTSRAGAFMLVPQTNPFLEDCQRAARLLIDAFCAKTGANNLGIVARDDQTGFNWCERMIINIEMGHMTNPEEGKLLSDLAYWDLMAVGLCEGILAYFEGAGL